jgi:GntR family transcriptional regulator/MocR family aminotransferase
VPKTRPVIAFTLGPRTTEASLLRWLYGAIRSAIVDGRLAPGARLPSTRAFAAEYRLARGTVVGAFDQLISEGYLESSVGNGTYVRRGISGVFPDAEPRRPRMRARRQRAALSARGQRLARNPFPQLSSNLAVEAFRLDRPAVDAFPTKLWAQIAARHLHRADPKLLGSDDPLGFRPLREAVAGHVASVRGVRCAADQVVITRGTQHSLDLILRLVLDRGDRAWMEDPGYAAVTSLMRGSGAEVTGVPVDSEGLDCEAGMRLCRTARLAYVTPGCQFPLGVTMSLSRRLALLRWAAGQAAWIFEDDYDGQLEFSGRPLGALQSLDTQGCVIYSNSFNKMLFTSLRLGFMVLPSSLIDAARAAKSITDRFSSTLDQATLSDFIVQGHLEQHMRRMRALYAERLATLIRSTRSELDGLMRVEPSTAGLQVMGWLAKGIPEIDAWRGAAAQGVSSAALSLLTISRHMPPGLALGVTSASAAAIRAAIRRLREVLRGLRPQVR